MTSASNFATCSPLPASRRWRRPSSEPVTTVGERDAATGKRPPIYVKEEVPWFAVRNAAHSYGFAAFTPRPAYPFESFTLRRTRRD